MSLEHEPVQEPEVVEVLRLRTEQEFGPIPQTAFAEPLQETLSKPRWLRLAGAGLVLMLAAFLLVPHPQMAASIVTPFTALGRRTVPVGSVTYGPDIAPGFAVDPSFAPSGGLPTGLSISAMAGKTIWGCGDHKVGGAQPPEGTAARLVESRLVELLEYVRHQHVDPVPVSPYFMKDPKFTTKLPSVPVSLSLEWRNGLSGSFVTVPTVDGPKADAELRRIAHNAAKQMTDAVADSIQWTRNNDPNLP